MRTLTKKFLLATFLALSMEVSAKASMVTMTLRNVTVKDAIVDLQKKHGLLSCHLRQRRGHEPPRKR